MYNYDAMTQKWRKFITESYSDQEKILDLLNSPAEDVSLQGLEIAEVAMPDEYNKAVDMALQHFSTIFDETLDFEDDLPTVRKALKKNKDFEKVVNLRNIAKNGFMNTNELKSFIEKYLTFRDYIVKKYEKLPQVSSAFYDNALSMREEDISSGSGGAFFSVSGYNTVEIEYVDLFSDKNKFKEEYVLHYLKEILG
mgnify:CR=1 FL=1